MNEVPYDHEGEIVYVPETQVSSTVTEHKSKDGSYWFKMLGGPFHDKPIRVYPPFTVIVFREPSLVVYKIHPPKRADGAWCYVHAPELEQEYESWVDPYRPNPHTVVKAENLHQRYKILDDARIEALRIANGIRYQEQIDAQGEDDG